jgi:hypothetical protein
VKRDMLEVVDGLPPIYDAIVQVLPEAANDGVIFAYGGKVYGRGLKKLSRELDAHERAHLERQGADSDAWWKQYLTDVEFRYREELVAHQAEYRTYCARHINPIKRAQALRQMAQRLTSPLYGTGGLIENVMLAIRYPAAPFSVHDLDLNPSRPVAHEKKPNEKVVISK